MAVVGCRRWSVSGVTSMSAHGALVVGWMWWSVHHPLPPREPQVAELEVRAAPPPAAPPPPLVRVAAAPAALGHARPARGVNLGQRPAPVSYESSDFVAPRIGLPDGDEDSTLDDPSPSTLRGPPGPPGPVGAGPPPKDQSEISPLDAAYLCTYQSLRSLPRALYSPGKVYRLLVQLCISAEGRVSSATLQKGAAAELDTQVLTDLREWRYKPRIVHGKPTAFCYKVRVSYEVE
jgi:hypothetical protein